MVEELIHKYCEGNEPLEQILLRHSSDVAQRALKIAKSHPELKADETLLWEAAMLHDIGIKECNAAGIHCFGTQPYICHGTIGAEMLRQEGYPRHALVCERHTGTGLTLDYIETNNLPLPHRDLVPISLEEQLICFADKFFSKTHPEQEKTKEAALKSVAKFGDECAEKFNHWCKMFL